MLEVPGRRRRLVELLWRTFCTSKNLSWTCLERATSAKTLRRAIARRALRWTSLTYSTVRPQVPTDGADTRSPLALVFLLLYHATSHNHPRALTRSNVPFCLVHVNSGARCRWRTNPGRIGPGVTKIEMGFRVAQIKRGFRKRDCVAMFC